MLIDESTNFSEIPESEIDLAKESRYPNKNEIMEIMSLGTPEFLGDVDDIYPDDISEHQNKVELVNINSRELIELNLAGKKIKCVFKPFIGENNDVKENDVKKNNGKIQKFYPREVFAFELSEYLGFDIVPPTIVRDFNGKGKGALQLFIPTDQYLSEKKLEERYPDAEEESWQKIIQTDDFAKMLAFDFIIANCDRNPGNYLVKIIRENNNVQSGISNNPREASLVAIDHGMCMDSSLYSNTIGEKDGPIKIVTDGNKKIKIPSNVLTLLSQGLEKRNDFNAEFIDEEISEEEVEYMWMRIAALCKTGFYLSKYNIRNYPELLIGNGVLAKHPQIFVPGY